MKEPIFKETLDEVGKLLSDLGLDPKDWPECQRWLSHPGSESTFLGRIQYLDLYHLGDSTKSRIRSLYLKVKAQEKYSPELFQIFIAFGKQSIFELIKPYEI